MKRIRDLFLQPELSPAWIFNSPGLVWRMLFGPTGTIVGESRFQEEKRVSFFALDERTGGIRWRDVSLHELWWVGLEAVAEDIVIFHGFASPDMPAHRGLYAHSLADGNARWSNPDTSYWFHTNERVYGLKNLFDRRIGVELDIHTGDVLMEHREGLDSLAQLRESQTVNDQTNGLMFPESAPFVSLPDWASKCVAERRSGVNCVGESDCILHNGVFVFNIYRRAKAKPSESPSLQNALYVVTNEGKTLLHSGLIDHDVRFPVPDSFFVKDDQLMFVQGSRILTALRPWKS